MAKKLLILGAVLLPMALVVWIVDHHFRLKSGFASIEHGDTESRVELVLGEPYEVIKCGQFGGIPAAGCVKEFSYLSLLAFTDVWVVDFDANDRVIGKLRYRSP